MNTTLARASMIGLIAIMVGAGDSILRPVVLKAKEPVKSTLPVAGGSGAGAGTQGSAVDVAPVGEELSLNITVPQGFALHSAGVKFVDARERAEYEAGHIAGAYYMPTEEFSKGRPLALEYMDPKEAVVVYCGGGMCDASKNVVIRLQAMGFERCHIMTDGYPKWVESGHPIAAGKPEYE